MKRYYGFTDNALNNPVRGLLDPTNLLLSKYPSAPLTRPNPGVPALPQFDSRYRL
jgi:hypothetical protein